MLTEVIISHNWSVQFRNLFLYILVKNLIAYPESHKMLNQKEYIKQTAFGTNRVKDYRIISENGNAKKKLGWRPKTVDSPRTNKKNVIKNNYEQN